MNTSDTLTAREHIELLAHPLPATDAVADGQDTVYRRVEAFPWSYAERRGLPAYVLLPSFLTKPRNMCDDLLSDYRRAFASMPDLPGAQPVDTRGLDGRTIDPATDFGGESVTPWEQEKPQQAQVPIMVHRSGKTVVRHIIRGEYTFDDAMRRIDGYTYDDYQRAIWGSAGEMLGYDLVRRERQVKSQHLPTQCEFATHYGSDRHQFSWQIACGQFLCVLRCCMSCWTEFVVHHEINVPNCRVIDPLDSVG
jgi:hypothetical protein